MKNKSILCLLALVLSGCSTTSDTAQTMNIGSVDPITLKNIKRCSTFCDTTKGRQLHHYEQEWNKKIEGSCHCELR